MLGTKTLVGSNQMNKMSVGDWRYKIEELVPLVDSLELECEN